MGEGSSPVTTAMVREKKMAVSAPHAMAGESTTVLNATGQEWENELFGFGFT
jgi:hypothetical protein